MLEGKPTAATAAADHYFRRLDRSSNQADPIFGWIARDMDAQDHLYLETRGRPSRSAGAGKPEAPGIDARIALRFPSALPAAAKGTLGLPARAGIARRAPDTSQPAATSVRRPAETRTEPRPRTHRPKGVSPDGIRYDAVRRVFAQAERAMGTKWPLFGRGHCERVTLKAHYSRHARLGAQQSVMHFAPSGSMARV